MRSKLRGGMKKILTIAAVMVFLSGCTDKNTAKNIRDRGIHGSNASLQIAIRLWKKNLPCLWGGVSRNG